MFCILGFLVTVSVTVRAQSSEELGALPCYHFRGVGLTAPGPGSPVGQASPNPGVRCRVSGVPTGWECSGKLRRVCSNDCKAYTDWE